MGGIRWHKSRAAFIGGEAQAESQALLWSSLGRSALKSLSRNTANRDIGRILRIFPAETIFALPRRKTTMPTGPKGEKRPADVIGNAVKVMRILTGEEPEDYGDAPEKNQAAAELGRKGGKKRAESMTSERRAEIAKKAAAKRWSNPSK